MSTDGHWCQCHTNRKPPFGARYRGKFYSMQNSSIMIQHSCEAALGPGHPLARRLRSTSHWSALLCSLLPAVLWSAPFGASLLWPALVCSATLRYLLCFSSAEETCASVFGGNGKCAPGARGELAHIERNPHLWPLIGPSSFKLRLQLLKV